MQSTNLQFKINYLRDVLANFSNTERKMIGVTIIRENSSDNWLFNTQVDLNEIVPIVCTKLETEIAQLETELAPILAAEQEAERIRLEQEAQAEAERLTQQQLEDEALAKTEAILNAINKGKAVILEYLKDNREIDLTTEQSLQQLQKFAAIKGLLEVGAIDAAVDLLLLAEVDEIFTQERKDKYLSML